MKESNAMTVQIGNILKQLINYFMNFRLCFADFFDQIELQKTKKISLTFPILGYSFTTLFSF